MNITATVPREIPELDHGPHLEPQLKRAFREPAAHIRAAIGAIELNIGDAMPMSEARKSYAVVWTHFE